MSLAAKYRKGRRLGEAAGKARPGPPASPAVEATRLLGRWSNLSQQHLTLGAGCGCIGAGSVGVQGRDLEQQILDFVYQRQGTEPAVAALFTERAGYRWRDSGSIAELLRAVATTPDGAHGAGIAEVLMDLQRSIDSIEEAHRR